MFGIEDRRSITLNWTQRAVCALIFSICFLFSGFPLECIKHCWSKSVVYIKERFYSSDVGKNNINCSYSKGEPSVSEVLVSRVQDSEHSKLNTSVFGVSGSSCLVRFVRHNDFVAKVIDGVLSQCCCLYGFQLWSLSGLEDFFILINAMILVFLNGYNFCEEVLISFVIGSSVERHFIYSFILSINMFLLLLSERGPDLCGKISVFFLRLVLKILLIFLLSMILVWIWFSLVIDGGR